MKKLVSLLLAVSLLTGICYADEAVLNDNNAAYTVVPENYLIHQVDFVDGKINNLGVKFSSNSPLSSISKCPGWFPCGKPHGTDENDKRINCPGQDCDRKVRCSSWEQHVRAYEIIDITIPLTNVSKPISFPGVDGYAALYSNIETKERKVDKNVDDMLVLKNNGSNYTISSNFKFSILTHKNLAFSKNPLKLANYPDSVDVNSEYQSFVKSAIEEKEPSVDNITIDENGIAYIPFNFVDDGTSATANVKVTYCTGAQKTLDNVPITVYNVKSTINVKFGPVIRAEQKDLSYVSAVQQYDTLADVSSDLMTVTIPSMEIKFTPYYTMKYVSEINSNEAKNVVILSNTEQTFRGADALSVRIKNIDAKINGQTTDRPSFKANDTINYENKVAVELRGLIHLQDPEYVSESERESVIRANNERVSMFISAFDDIQDSLSNNVGIYTNLWQGNSTNSVMFNDYFAGKDFARANTQDGMEIDEVLTRFSIANVSTKSSQNIKGFYLGKEDATLNNVHTIDTPFGTTTITKPFSILDVVSLRMPINSKQRMESLLQQNYNNWYTEQYNGILMLYVTRSIELDVTTNNALIHPKITSYSNILNAEARTIYHPFASTRNSKSVLIKGLDTPDSDVTNAGFGVGTEITVPDFKLGEYSIPQKTFYVKAKMFDVTI